MGDQGMPYFNHLALPPRGDVYASAGLCLALAAIVHVIMRPRGPSSPKAHAPDRRGATSRKRDPGPEEARALLA